jgi:hypothetical protein
MFQFHSLIPPMSWSAPIQCQWKRCRLEEFRCPSHTDIHTEMEEEEKQKCGGGGGGTMVVVVEPKPRKGLTSKVVDFVEKLIVNFMHDTSQPLLYLSGNFAPVAEETPPATALLVKGFLPVRKYNYLSNAN